MSFTDSHSNSNRSETTAVEESTVNDAREQTEIMGSLSHEPLATSSPITHTMESDSDTSRDTEIISEERVNSEDEPQDLFLKLKTSQILQNAGNSRKEADTTTAPQIRRKMSDSSEFDTEESIESEFDDNEVLQDFEEFEPVRERSFPHGLSQVLQDTSVDGIGDTTQHLGDSIGMGAKKEESIIENLHHQIMNLKLHIVTLENKKGTTDSSIDLKLKLSQSEADRQAMKIENEKLRQLIEEIEERQDRIDDANDTTEDVRDLEDTIDDYRNALDDAQIEIEEIKVS